MEDNVYSGLRTGTGTEIPASLAAYSSRDAEVLTIGSLGEAVWASLRIGWIQAPAAITERLARRKTLADNGTVPAMPTRWLPSCSDVTAGGAAVPGRHT